MEIQIHRFTNAFSLVSSISVTNAGLSNSSGMTISHYAGSVKSSEVTIPYEIEGTANHVPYIEDAEFCVVVRKKVDLTATGVNQKEIKDIGEDIGKYKYTNSSPSTLFDLPPGFQELYKKS